MTADELSARLDVFVRQELDGDGLRKQALLIANNLRDKVRERVQTRGFGPEERAFASYVPDYAKRRNNKGFQIRHVDYTRSGRLWAGIIVETVDQGPQTVTVAIGPRDDDGANILKGKGALAPRKDGVRRGLITQPSPGELQEAFEDWATDVYDKFIKTVGT